MNPGLDLVGLGRGRGSDSTANLPGRSIACDLSAGAWTSMQLDSQAHETQHRRLQDAPNTVSLTNRQLLDRFDALNRTLTNEIFRSPMDWRLTPEFHSTSEQMIREADNLPHDQIRKDHQQSTQRFTDLRTRIGQTENALIQASYLSPELRQMIPDLLKNIDSERWGSNQETRDNLARLRKIAPQVADTLDSRKEMGEQLKEESKTLSDLRKLQDMPIDARFQYAMRLVQACGGEEQRAVKYLTEMLNARPETLNYRAPSGYGVVTMGDLIVGSGALQSKGSSLHSDVPAATSPSS